MDTKNGTLPGNYHQIMRVREEISETLANLLSRKEALYNIHEELLTLNNTQLFVFGLDSLQFQQQLIQLEYQNMSKLYQVIQNRIYGDLYKLHGLVVSFIRSNRNISVAIPIPELGHGLPVYDDIDIYHEFEFRYVARIVQEISDYLQELRKYLGQLNQQLDKYQAKQQIGLNINNFVFAFQNCQQDLDNRVSLFQKYFEYFLSLHLGYLEKFKAKLSLSQTQVNKDIRLDSEDVTQTLFSLLKDPEIDTGNLGQAVTGEADNDQVNDIIVRTSMVDVPTNGKET
jgi:hypothetical protein